MTVTIKTLKPIEGIVYTFTASSISNLNSEWKSDFMKGLAGLVIFDEFYIVYSDNLVLIVIVIYF